VSVALAAAHDLAPAPSQRLRDAAVIASEAPATAAPNLDALWRALVEGRYRFIECFERSGRRYYVLYEDLGEPGCAVGLTARERTLAEAVGRGESEKGVAFALGVTPSGASATLKSALVKLGLRSKVDLVLLVGALCDRTARGPTPGVAHVRTDTPTAAPRS
jgi:DNA-binding CsgD family transcriptional regulator